jgi:hypothetical protein
LSSVESQLFDDIEQDDRIITIAVILTVYPELTIKDAFEILDDPLLLETLLIEMALIPRGSIEELTA